MYPLHQALRSLQEQLLSGLSQSSSQSSSPQSVRPQLATVSLGLVLQTVPQDPLHPESSSPLQWAVVPPGTVAQHHVTLQLDISSIVATKSGLLSTPSSPTTIPQDLNASGPRAERLFKQCLAVFGNPGFDNAARAEVFCELAAETSVEHLSAGIEHAGSESKISPLDPLARLTSRLRQIFAFSPVGPKRASIQLRQLIQETSMDELTTLLRERWRFGTHWSSPPSTNGIAGT